MERISLGKICDVTSSKRVFAKDYIPFGIPFYRGKEITEYSVSHSIKPEFFISESLFEEISAKYGAPKEGDILITAVGTLGSLMYVQDQKFYFKDGNIIWLRNFCKTVDSKFIYYLLSSKKYKDLLLGSAIGSTQRAFTIEMLKSVDLTLPDLKTQQHIVNTILFLLLKSL